MTQQQPLLLVVDDEAMVLDVVRRFAEGVGFDVRVCNGGREALEYLTQHSADLALVDVRMPEVGGIDVLRALRQADPACQVVIMSGYASVDTAVEAIKLGAIDFLSKPFDFPRLKELLQRVREEVARRRALLEAETRLARDLEFCGMIGRSAAMQEIFEIIRRLAPHLRVALVTGETGTGKELVARALHKSGPRRTRRFVTVNCSAVVETLFESELFGHVRGAFTGATDHKPGLFEQADGGTIFLDEVGELPLAVQAKLLRVLESGEVQRVGSLEPRKVDVRVIAATNRDLDREVAAGRFRSDLYYRLNVVEIHLPPLRERREDVPYLVAAFVREVTERLGKRLAGPTTSAERQLMAAPWPGNIRELRNTIERTCMLAEGEFITERELVGTLRPGARSSPLVTHAPPMDAAESAERERAEVKRVLDESRGSKAEAARRLGISRRALYRRLERLGLVDLIERQEDGGTAETS